MNKNNSNAFLKITNPICYSYSIVWVYTSNDPNLQSLVQLKWTNENLNLLSTTLDDDWFFLKENLINHQNKDEHHHLVYFCLLRNKWGQNISEAELQNFLTKNNIKPVDLTAHQIAEKNWYQLDVKQAINLLTTLKATPGTLDLHLFDKKIELHPEQQEAIELTSYSYLNGGKQFLWACKIGFGKRLSTMHLILQSFENKLNFKKIMIVSNKAGACDEWFNAFKKCKMALNGFKFYSNTNGDRLESIYRLNESKKAICFYNLQDLRTIKLSDDNPFNSDSLAITKFDLFVINEIDEGTQSILPGEIKKSLSNISPNAKWLHLADTAYKVLDLFHKNQIFSWSYLKEQEAKHAKGDELNNPYLIYPAIKQYLINLAQDLNIEPELINTDNDDNGCLRYLFATKKIDNEYCFEREALVKRFIDLLVDKHHPNYPFATSTYRQYFKHSFWFVANIAVGKALIKLLKHHNVFSNYTIVDITNTNINPTQAKKLITDAINNHEYTITISCKRLVRDINIPQWTACLYLAATMATSVIAYMQTIFRIQTPWILNKEEGYKDFAYLFDFAPHKALNFREELAKLQQLQTGQNFIATLQLNLRYLPIISYCHHGFTSIDVSLVNDEIQAYCHPIQHKSVKDEVVPLIGELVSQKHNPILNSEELKHADIIIVPSQKEIVAQQEKEALHEAKKQQYKQEIKQVNLKTQGFFKRTWKKFLDWLDKVLP